MRFVIAILVMSIVGVGYLVYQKRYKVEETVVRVPLMPKQNYGFEHEFIWPHVTKTMDLVSHFERAGVNYPPQKLSLLAFKLEKRLELWAYQENRWIYVHAYPILGASGHEGPKLFEGDRQVPEGIYRVMYLNPDSKFHLSIKINYPNQFDMKYARLEGRERPGDNIFIHGDRKSIGCLAMGNEVIEQLYALVSDTGLKNIKVIIAPYDMRIRRVKFGDKPDPWWLPELYQNIRRALRVYPYQKRKISEG